MRKFNYWLYYEKSSCICCGVSVPSLCLVDGQRCARCYNAAWDKRLQEEATVENRQNTINHKDPKK